MVAAQGAGKPSMFVDFEAWPPPQPPKPEPPKPRFTKRDERVFRWLVGLFLLSWVFAPFAGESLVVALWGLFKLAFGGAPTPPP